MHLPYHKNITASIFSQVRFYSKVCGIVNNILPLAFWPFSGKHWQLKNWMSLEMGCNSVNSGQVDDIPHMGLLLASISFSFSSCQTHGAISNIHLGSAKDDSKHLLSRADSEMTVELAFWCNH